MIYEDILSLDYVKNFLRIDTDFNETDYEIITMRDAALRYIEKQTNHIMIAQDKTYTKSEGALYLDVFDYPINSVPDDVIELKYSLKSRFNVNEVVLNVGYNDPKKVPAEFIQAALQMIKVWYYEAEKQVNTTLIPENVKEIIQIYKRFIAC